MLRFSYAFSFNLVNAFATNFPIVVGAEITVAAIEQLASRSVIHQVIAKPSGRRATEITGVTDRFKVTGSIQLTPEHRYVGAIIDRP